MYIIGLSVSFILIALMLMFGLIYIHQTNFFSNLFNIYSLIMQFFIILLLVVLLYFGFVLRYSFFSKKECLKLYRHGIGIFYFNSFLRPFEEYASFLEIKSIDVDHTNNKIAIDRFYNRPMRILKTNFENDYYEISINILNQHKIFKSSKKLTRNE
jgi:hypothetical protein